jgi:hypothetical protein
MLCNLTAGLICLVSAAQGALGAPPDQLGQIICSEHGPVRLPPVDDQPASERTLGLCQHCLAAASTAVEPRLAMLPSPVAHPIDRAVAPVSATTFAEALRRSGLESRGPPLPA